MLRSFIINLKIAIFSEFQAGSMRFWLPLTRQNPVVSIKIQRYSDGAQEVLNQPQKD